MEAAGAIKVWDPFVRVGHWLVVAGFFVSYVASGGERGDAGLLIHVWAGYPVAAVLLLRLGWGFIGPRHARFGSFLYSPLAVLPYLVDLVRGRAVRHLGHSPAGAAMIFTLMLAIAGTGFTGLWVYAQDSGTGPFSPWVAQVERPARSPAALAPGTLTPDRAAAFANRRPRSAMLSAHQLIGDATLWLVILHIGGVLLASWAHGENLIKAMVNGRKRGPEPGEHA